MLATRNIIANSAKLSWGRSCEKRIIYGRRTLATPAGLLRQKKNIDLRGWALLSVPLATFGLGTWQVQRRRWKLDLIEDLQRRTNSEPRELPEDISELNGLEYYPVRVRGYFDHTKELFMGPRSLIKDGDAASEGGLISKNAKSNTGYCVVTPFHLSDKNLTILVNRGWVPKDKKNPATRSSGQVEEEVELVGVVRLNETRPPFSPENKGNLWFYRDLMRMAEMTDASPVLLDASAESSVRGGPVGGQTRVTLRNEHLSYILTWYSLSALTGIMWLRMFVFR